MHGLDTTIQLNTEHTIKCIIARGAERGLQLTRDEVLEELAAFDGTDQTVWGATVDRLLTAR